MKPALHRQLPANARGRDFVVGDLHGCLDLFQAELQRVGFDPDVDRVLGVGDLADRGPDSMGCLRLLNEPWFHAVRGNHEQMLLDYAFPVDIPFASANNADRFMNNGGHWVESLTPEERHELWTVLLPKVARLPYVITVGHEDAQFHLVHAELMSGSPRLGSQALQHLATFGKKPDSRILTNDQLNDEMLIGMQEALVWGRRVIRDSRPERATATETPIGPMLLSRRPWHPGLSLTYAGHTIVKKMRLHASHLFIDRGAFQRTRDSELLMLCHQEVEQVLAELTA